MNYIQTCKDTIRILRTTKLAWVFGLLSLLTTITDPLSKLVSDNPLSFFIYIPVSLAIMCFSLIGAGGFIYVIYQKTLGQNFTFSDAWFHSKTKFFSILVSLFPATFLAFLISMVLKYALPNPSFHWYITFIAGWFSGSIIIFSMCAIIINNVKTVSALQTGFIIAIRNFFHVLIIACTARVINSFFASLLIGILRVFNYSATQKIMNIPIQSTAAWILFRILMVPTTVFLILAYLKFTEQVSYPALSNQQNAA